MPVHPVSVVQLEAEVDRCERRDGAGHADRSCRGIVYVVRDSLREQRADRLCAAFELLAGRGVRVQKALGDTHGSDIETVVPPHAVWTPGDDLSRAAAEV